MVCRNRGWDMAANIAILKKELAGYGAGQLFLAALRCRISEGRLHLFQ